MRRFFYVRQSKLGIGLKTRGLWFAYRGHPVYLMGSGTESIYAGDFAAAPPGTTENEIRAQWLRYLERLADHHINLVRFFPWAFCWDAAAPPWACPYPQMTGSHAAPARYNLTRVNDGFFETVRYLCREAQRRDIFVTVVLFDDCALSPGGVAGGPWSRHPFNAACGGPCVRPADFYDLRAACNQTLQEAFARRVFAATSDLPNVLYDVCNEVGASVAGGATDVGAWLRHYLAFARQQAPAHLLGVSGSAWSADGGSAEEFWQESDIDVLMPHESDGRAALYREMTAHQFRFYERQGIEKPRLLSEIGFGEPVSYDEERRHFWVALTSGGHAARAAGQTFAVTPTFAFCRALGEFLKTSGLRWWEMRPVEDLLTPDPSRAYALGDAARGEYLVYFLDRPAERVTLRLPGGPLDVRLCWIDAVHATVLEETVSAAASPLAFPGGGGDIALWIRSAT